MAKPRGTSHVGTWHRGTWHVARGHVAPWHVARGTWHLARRTCARGTWHVARRTWHLARGTCARGTVAHGTSHVVRFSPCPGTPCVTCWPGRNGCPAPVRNPGRRRSTSTKRRISMSLRPSCRA